jgi:hypothetical protein
MKIRFFNKVGTAVFSHPMSKWDAKGLASLPLCLVLTGALLRAEPSTVAPPSATADPLAEVLPILQAKYADFPALNYKPGDKLEDLITRSGGGISLEPAPLALSPTPILNATLPDNVIYWRLASFALPQGKTWADLATQLRQASSTATGIILDLRSNSTPDDYQGAKQTLGFFMPVEKTAAPLTEAPVVVLTDSRTAGAAEALAGYLQADGALVMGQATAGKVGVFGEQKLSSGEILRYVVPTTPVDDPALAFKFRAEVPTWGHPVLPDISIATDERAEKSALTLIRDNHVMDVIQESAARHRMSEASLVQGQDPEWDDYLSSLEQKPVLLSLPVIHDVVLISALDSLKAIRFSQATAPAQSTTTANASSPPSASVQ